jgi:hypothetical protein
MHNDHSLRKALGKSDCLHQTGSLTLLVSFAAVSELAEARHRRAIRCAKNIILAFKKAWLLRVILCALTSCSLHVALPLADRVESEQQLQVQLRDEAFNICREKAVRTQLRNRLSRPTSMWRNLL